jgi:outer membrane protein insertion porin family
MTSCNVMSRIPENNSLLVSNKIIQNTDDDFLNKWFIEDELLSIPLQKPNKKFLWFFPLKLMIYSSVEGKKETKFRWWVKNKIGEPPMIFDSAKVSLTEQLLYNYYQNKGFFFTQVKSTIKTNRKRKTSVVYDVTTGKGFRFRNIYFPYSNNIDSVTYKSKESTLLKKGTNFDIVKLKFERERIADDVNNEGYYYFSKDYVFFEIDTFHYSQEVDVRVSLAKYNDSTDFEKYTFDSVFVYSNYNPEQQIRNIKMDTIFEKEYQYIHSIKKFKTAVLSKYISLNKDSLYKKSGYQNTIQKLSELGEFRYINLSFQDKYSTDSALKLNAYLMMTPYKKQFFSSGLEAYNNFEGLIGSGVTLAYNNRNLSKNADKLTISMTLGAEINLNKNTQNTVNNRTDILFSSEYNIRKFLIPFIKVKERPNVKVTSRANATYNFENRIGFYSLHNVSTAFGYNWNRVEHRKYTYNPFSLSLTVLPDSSLSDSFRNRLASNHILNNIFNNNFIIGSQYQVFFKNKSIPNQKVNHTFTNSLILETAGNFVELEQILEGKKGHDKEVFGRNYSQFFKIVNELRHQSKLNDHATLNTKFKFGIGIPYGNSQYMPYTKQFFIGGPNSVRAFPVRTLGPGGYKSVKSSSSQIIDEIGDILLEGSVEYRFNVIKYINGA